MKTSIFCAELPFHAESVWAVMTDTTQYAWRSDVKAIETDSDTVFREIYPNGNETVFTITEKEPFTRYAFHMENKRFSGEWSGTLEELAQGGCRLILEERIEIHNPLMHLVAGMAWNLNKLQQTYVHDIKEELVRRKNCKEASASL